MARKGHLSGEKLGTPSTLFMSYSTEYIRRVNEGLTEHIICYNEACREMYLFVQTPASPFLKATRHGLKFEFSSEGTMTAVMPEGEALRKAVKWISAELNEHPDKPVNKLVNEAVQRFDLSPKDSEFLLSFYKKGGSPSTAN